MCRVTLTVADSFSRLLFYYPSELYLNIHNHTDLSITNLFSRRVLFVERGDIIDELT